MFNLSHELFIFGWGLGRHKACPTQRAPDVWESAAFTGIFLASGFSYISSLVHARPHAGNANRWAASLMNKVFVQNKQ